MKKLCLVLFLGLLVSFESIAQAPAADPDVNILMSPASMTLNSNGILSISTCNNGNLDIVANSLRITVSVGVNAEILGLAPGSDARWTVLTSTTGTNNTYSLKNTNGTMTQIAGVNPCATINLIVKGTVVGSATPSTITGTIGYIAGPNPLLPGNAPSSSQGNSSTANDNSTTSLTVTAGPPPPTCSANQLFLNPPVNTDYFGGFESGANNFGVWVPGDNSKFSAGTALAAAQYTITSSPNLVNFANAMYPPLGGNNQMVISSPTAGTAVWYLLDTSLKVGAQQYGFITQNSSFFKVNISKLNTGTNPVVRLKFYDVENPANIYGDVTATISAAPGTWTEVSNFLVIDGAHNKVTKKIRIDVISVNGVGFSLDQMCASLPLNGPAPISLLNFNATKQTNSVQLSWQTTSEINSKNFEVLRSQDGINWTSIGTVAASGNSSTQKSYGLVDNSPSKGTNYYRLKQFDLDARYSLSDIRIVIFGSTGGIKILPNPVVDRVYVTTTGTINLQSVVVYSAEGKQVQRFESFALGNGIDMSRYAAGTYMLKITDQQGNTEVRTIFKQ